MKTHRKKNWILLVLALIFLAPGCGALFFFMHPQWLAKSPLTNRGTLIKQPEQIFSAHVGKWQLVLWYPGRCAKDCQQQLERLAKIRLALGRHLYEVKTLLATTSGKATFGLEDKLLLDEQDIGYRYVTASISQNLGDKAQIFIANPENFLILRYPLSANPADIYHDIKILINSGQQSG